MELSADQIKKRRVAEYMRNYRKRKHERRVKNREVNFATSSIEQTQDSTAPSVESGPPSVVFTRISTAASHLLVRDTMPPPFIPEPSTSRFVGPRSHHPQTGAVALSVEQEKDVAPNGLSPSSRIQKPQRTHQTIHHIEESNKSDAHAELRREIVKRKRAEYMRKYRKIQSQKRRNAAAGRTAAFRNYGAMQARNGGTFRAEPRCPSVSSARTSITAPTSLAQDIVQPSEPEPSTSSGFTTSNSTMTIQKDFQRINSYPLRTCQEILLDFIKKKSSSFSFNMQSLRAHRNDLQDQVTQKSKILMLSESCADDNESIDIPNFDCCVQYERPERRSATVAIYRKGSSCYVITPNMHIKYRQTERLGAVIQDVGEICVAECELPNGQIIISAAVYISPNQPVQKIIDFIHRVLLPFTRAGSALLERDDHLRPMIFSGNFNINFNHPTSKPLTTFLADTLGLKLNSEKISQTTCRGTSIDAAFHRFLHKLESQIYISYFRYPEPILSSLRDYAGLTSL